uniref:Uncharacterized protein n=1 Tax=Rhizophora mucronata TaxID=61149 RepID=A0A2P2JCD4_RHIMU
MPHPYGQRMPLPMHLLQEFSGLQMQAMT